MCRVLGVVRQSFYRWLQLPEGIRKKEDKRLLPEIRKIFMGNRQIYGPKRIAKHFRKDGMPCGKTRAKRLMEEAGLKPKRRTKFKKTKNSSAKNPFRNLSQKYFKDEKKGVHHTP